VKVARELDMNDKTLSGWVSDYRRKNANKPIPESMPDQDRIRELERRNRLEQGRYETPSAQVAAALARALQLTDAERDHLYRLAGLAPPARGEISDHIPPGLSRMLNRLGDAAEAVFAADWQLIWWNRGWAGLLGDPSWTPPALRNFARDTFPVDGAAPRLSHWPVTSLNQQAVEASVVSDLRRATGRFPGSGRLASLIQTSQPAARASPSFGLPARSARTGKTTRSSSTWR
jgi:hypothetical protein